jgi:hypothetical protein
MAYTTINKSGDYFNTKLYTGNGSTNAQTGVGFQPDFTWIKARSNAENHNLFDAVRGATKRIRSNGTEAEDTRTTSLTAFGSDGFTLGSGSQVNTSGWTFASWNWKANGTGSANTAGSINSTVSANTTSGFSSVSYSGTGVNATIGHGLNSAPELVFYKRRNGVDGWKTYAKPIGNDKVLTLDTTNTASTTSYWQNTDPSSTVLTVADGGGFNTSGGTYVAYCFHSVKGYSKIGSYTGNGSTNGTFIYTGFKPAFVITKAYSGYAGYWTIHDSVRNPSNVSTMNALWSNSADAGAASYGFDLLSNGFKIRTTSATLNQSGAGYIYMAFAEAPLVGTNGVTAKAR